MEEETALPTLDSLITPRAAEAPVPTLASQPYVPGNTTTSTTAATPAPPLETTPISSSIVHDGQQSHADPVDPLEAPQDAQDLEDSAHSEGAFNEATGEINWDCPCLGGMAHGTCGEQFRAAFSCFVYSKDEPKGMDCIDKFKEMQGCFREHPDEYGAELEEDEDEELMEGNFGDGNEGPGQIGLETGPGNGREAGSEVGQTPVAATTAAATEVGGQTKYPSGEPLPEAAKKGVKDAENMTAASEMVHPSAAPSATTTAFPSSSPSSTKPTTGREGEASTQRAKAAKSQMQTQQSAEPTSESEALVPKAAHDARMEDAKGEK